MSEKFHGGVHQKKSQKEDRDPGFRYNVSMSEKKLPTMWGDTEEQAQNNYEKNRKAQIARLGKEEVERREEMQHAMNTTWVD